MSEKNVLSKPQVDRSIYFGPSYFSARRFASYANQLSEIMGARPSSVLEIGIGNGVVSHVLRTAGIRVTTADIDESLGPDLLASVTAIPLRDNSHDVIACFEVLEHLPFEHFGTALTEMARIAADKVILSLPDCKRAHYVEVKLPRIGVRRLQVEIPFIRPRKHSFNGEHYWEISKAGYPLQTIVNVVESAGFSVQKNYRLKENPYHRFFVLRKRN